MKEAISEFIESENGTRSSVVGAIDKFTEALSMIVTKEGKNLQGRCIAIVK